MGTITNYERRTEKYHEGQANTVLSVTEARQYAVRYTDSEGKETMCLVIKFGKMADGGPGIFMLANATAMAENLKQISGAMLEQVRDQVAALDPNAPVEITDNPDVVGVLANLDLEDSDENSKVNEQ